MKWAWHFCRCTSDGTIFYGSYKKSDWIKFKGYFCYKLITSQNVPSEAQVKNFFHRKVMFHSQDIQVFVFLIIPSFTKSTTPWWILVHEAVHFLCISFEPQLIKPPNLANWLIQGRATIFQESFEQFKNAWNYFSSLQHWTKHIIEMSAIKLTNIGPNFVLIVRRILKK